MPAFPRAISNIGGGIIAIALSIAALIAAACSSSTLSPTAPSDSSATVVGSGISEPATQPGPCRGGVCKDTQNLTLGVVTFHPAMTYIVGATVTIKAPTAPYTVLATGVTHRRGDVDFHISSSYSSILVDVEAAGYSPVSNYPVALPAREAYWIALTLEN